MALSKITLTLGKGKSKQKISLTPEQFEELKQDMRDLDRSHDYYWHRSPWYQPWYYNSSGTMFTSTSGYANTSDVYLTATSASGTASSTDTVTLTGTVDPAPPAFKGKVLSAR